MATKANHPFINPLSSRPCPLLKIPEEKSGIGLFT
jgi:hypothetical protein